MKKFFVALMAVLVLASCGGKKETTPAEVMMMTVDVINVATENVENATTSDEVIDATAALYSEMKGLQTNYGDVMASVETLSEDEQEEMFSVEYEAMQNAIARYSVAIISKMELMNDLTPEQERRWTELLESEF